MGASKCEPRTVESFGLRWNQLSASYRIFYEPPLPPFDDCPIPFAKFVAPQATDIAIGPSRSGGALSGVLAGVSLVFL